MLAEVTNLQERVEEPGGVLSICLTTTIMGWKNREMGGLEGLRQQGVMGRGWWVVLWGRRGGGVNIVMISPEFRSSGPMGRGRGSERERGRKGGREREREQLLSCHRQQP